MNTARIGKPVAPPIAPQAALLLVNTPVADDKREQEKIARLDEPRQQLVAQQIATGEAATVSEALILQARQRTPEPAITPPLPQGQYRCIVIDPPWPVKKIEREERPNQGLALDYPTMTLEEIAALPVKDFAYQDGCHLYLWVTQKYLPEGLRLMEAWGFRYQCVMTWVKPTGITPYSWMYNTEHILFGRVGNLPLAKLGIKLSLDAPVTGHSIKPDVFFDKVIQASPGPRLEMFARRAREGFEVWGNEVAA
jgi:N6-adenosine-specific RNA methylase IME4